MKPEDLRKWRSSAKDGGKINQSEAARLFGVSIRAWAYWESGQQAIPQSAAILLRIYQKHGIQILED
jgi:DNA-binding transcriptional regulator YiaG